MTSGNNAGFSVNPKVLYRDLKDASAMFWAAGRRKYPLPLRSLIWGILFLLYFALPFDLISEAAFLFLGFSDDLLLLVYVLNKMRPDIDKYRAFASANAAKKVKIKNEKTV